MYQVVCPQCSYMVGVGTFSDPGVCPNCDLPLMLTAEHRALSPDALLEASEQRRQWAQAPVSTGAPARAKARRTTSFGTP
jgi:hypothetical protein